MVKSFASYQSNNKLISSVMSSHTNIVRPVACFQLKSTSEFASRSVDVFSSLNTLENKHQSWMSHNETLEPFKDDNEPVPSTPDVFKKPFAPLPMKRKAKNNSRNRRNMKKWIKYSLADIPLSSDATNSAVAFQFLRDLRKKKEQEEADVTSSTDEKLLFSKPKQERKPSKPWHTDVASSSASETEGIVSNLSPLRSKKFSHQDKNDKQSVKLLHLQEDSDEA